MQSRKLPSFFLAKIMFAPYGEEECLINPLSISFLRCSLSVSNSYSERWPRGLQGGSLASGVKVIR